jgi:hypothetical protein
MHEFFLLERSRVADRQADVRSSLLVGAVGNPSAL